ncbi:hypothetical protein SDC9_201884 [bioreactor metagenome]|uniref:Uncharacterized protein n=1 Tax=bioreactor metagenome TaxID=1076179 RepID=A0A645J138_9ZZZZ
MEFFERGFVHAGLAQVGDLLHLRGGPVHVGDTVPTLVLLQAAVAAVARRALRGQFAQLLGGADQQRRGHNAGASV